MFLFTLWMWHTVLIDGISGTCGRTRTELIGTNFYPPHGRSRLCPWTRIPTRTTRCGICYRNHPVHRCCWIRHDIFSVSVAEAEQKVRSKEELISLVELCRRLEEETIQRQNPGNTKSNSRSSTMELKLHELRSETYNGMVRLLKPGCRTIVLLLDNQSKMTLIPKFHKAVWPYRK